MDYSAALKDYTRFDFDDGRWRRTVFRRGSGPAVIVVHEMPGIHPLVIRFADRVAAAGMTVFMPSLFGEPGRPVTRGYALGTMLKTICIAREFNVWHGGRSSPFVDWLRALARKAKAECGGRGVGAVGMCFTGGFALAMMTEDAVVAPVLSQPSMPATLFAGNASIDVSAVEMAKAKQRFEREDLSCIGLRFKGDKLVPNERFEQLKRELGSRFEAIELEDKDSAPGLVDHHSVLTVNLVDEPGSATKRAEERVIAFLKQRTAAR
ncbi:MAG: dienelactone hydrolase family protein [Alphaproteobacteria bacterium]|nr:dienelactone hydrolase family protein [Alphaproteobacteria bacterium]MBV9693130.1 dienelactone hydrolase family protein [Alphaproteobacteria bacterium]